MIKTTILAVTVLLFSTMMVQQVYAPEEQPEKISLGGIKAIPDWVKNQFEWYVNGEIDEKTLLTSMNWMFDNNIMHLSEKAAQEVNDLKMRNAELEKKMSAFSEKQYATDKESGEITFGDGEHGSIPSSGEEIYTDEYGRIKTKFPFDRADKDEVARFAAELYTKKIMRTQSSNTIWIPVIEDEVLVSFENGDPDRPIIIGRVYHSDMMPPYKLPDGKVISGMKTMQTTQPPKTDSGTMMKSGMSTSDDRPTEEVAFYYNKISFASKTVDDIMTKGGTSSAWKDGIAAFSQQGMHESVVDDLQGIVVLCNTAIDKKTQKIDAELKMIEEWLRVIEKNQSSETSYDAAGRITAGTTSESSVQYRESDLNFITRKLTSIDQQINSLDNGIKVLEDKLATIGDDAQLANMDLQNSLQKQQQTLQTMSNVSKMLHDTAMSVIRKIG